jgi:hypothetical protein
MKQSSTTRSPRVLLLALLAVSLLLLVWGVWSLATSFPDPYPTGTVTAPLSIPAPGTTPGAP